MLALLSPRMWLAVGVVIALTVSHGMAYKSGRAVIRAAWDAEKVVQLAAVVKASEEARAKEQVLQSKVTKVSNDYQSEKKRRTADAAVSADRLSALAAALASATGANPATTAGVDGDPRNSIVAECAGAIVKMDEAAKRLASQTIALQNYASSVCVNK